VWACPDDAPTLRSTGNNQSLYPRLFEFCRRREIPRRACAASVTLQPTLDLLTGGGIDIEYDDTTLQQPEAQANTHLFSVRVCSTSTSRPCHSPACDNNVRRALETRISQSLTSPTLTRRHSPESCCAQAAPTFATACRPDFYASLSGLPFPPASSSRAIFGARHTAQETPHFYLSHGH